MRVSTKIAALFLMILLCWWVGRPSSEWRNMAVCFIVSCFVVMLVEDVCQAIRSRK